MCLAKTNPSTPNGIFANRQWENGTPCTCQFDIKPMASLRLYFFLHLFQTSSKLYGGIPQRVKTITATMHRRRLHEDKDSSLLASNSSQTSIPRFNLRFQKKGQVQSVPFVERRHHSRAMDMDTDSSENYSENEEKTSDLVSALPLQTKYINVRSVAAVQTKGHLRVIFSVTLIMFSIPTRI